MAASTKLRLRGFWLQVHKWIGITLAVLIIPLCLTGSALVWGEWVDGIANPQRYPDSGEAALAPSVYAEAARGAAQPGERLQSLAFPDGNGSVQAMLIKPAEGGGRPSRATIYLDPASGQLIERAQGMSGIVGVFHQLHGSLLIPGVGRQIVGWIGVLMLISSLTGIWLWWPVTGSVRRGFRWRRQPTTNANLHYLGGFWIAIPLAMLSFTGAWISFPVFFGGLIGATVQQGPGGPPGAGQAQPLAETHLSPEAALAVARGQGHLAQITFPKERTPEWTVVYTDDDGRTETKVNDVTGAAVPAPPPPPEPFARLMRRLHDGTGMGPVWQTVIFVGGIIPAGLGVTGVIMWWRTRKWRGGAEPRRRAESVAAE